MKILPLRVGIGLMAVSLMALLAFMPLHPLYLSVTEIDYNAQAKSIEVSMKIFTTDLEEVLRAKGAGKGEIGTATEPAAADSIIAAYINEHFSITNNGQDLPVEYLGKEVGFEATWCYLEATNVGEVGTLEVKHSLLMDFFKQQRNIVHIQVDGNKKSLLLQMGAKTDKVSF